MCGNHSSWLADASSVSDPGPAAISETQSPECVSALERIGKAFTGIPMKARRLDAGDTLVTEGDSVTSFFILTEGLLCGSMARPEGGQRILGFYYPGDLILPGSSPEAWRQDLKAMTAASVNVVTVEALGAACTKDSHLGLRLFSLSCRDLSRRIEVERRLRALSVEGRFARFLLEVGARMGKSRNAHIVVPLPIMRTEIANYLGFRTETACRILARWKKRGLISTEDRRVIEIKDVRAIGEIAGDLGAPNVS